jgi:dienelactone hydrolase
MTTPRKERKLRFNIGALSGIIEIMKKGIISILLLIVITLTVRADHKVFEKVDPASIWNRDEFYKTPKTWKYEGFLKSDVKSIWIEGEPYKGKPTRSFAFYGIPSHASKNNKVPAMVLIHGGLGTAYDNWVRLWVKRGYAAICVDTCGSIPIRDMKGQWMSHPDGGPRGWGRPDMVDEPIKDQWPYHAVAAVMRSHSFIRSLECVDESKIGVTGVSWGGFLTCVAAAADERFAFAASVYGCGFNYEEGGLLWSKEGGEKWSNFDPTSGVVKVKIPNGACQAFVNIVADDSFIASSRIITVVQDNAANGN